MSLLEQAKADLKIDEGFRSYVYKDHLGFETIGYGFLVDRRRGGITEEEGDFILGNRLSSLEQSLKASLGVWDELPSQVRRAVLNMTYQLGLKGFLRFRKTVQYIKDGEYAKAADEALDSKWAEQTPARAQRVTSWLREA